MSQPKKNKCVMQFITYVKIRCMTKVAYSLRKKNRSIGWEDFILYTKWYNITCRVTLTSYKS